MFEIMDEMCELVHLVNVANYELLFINTAVKQMFCGNNDILDKKCYEVLQGRDSPCPLCTNSVLSKDKLITLNGIPARIEIAFDNTESGKEKNILKNTLESERLMMDCIRQLHLCLNLKFAIKNILKADRAYIFEIRDYKMFNTYECCANEIKAQIKFSQGLDEHLIDSLRPHFAENEYYMVEDTKNIRRNGPNEYDILIVRNIHSMIVASLEQNDKLVGYIGVDNPPVKKFNNVLVLFYLYPIPIIYRKN